jgi:hypothetical protein
MLAKVLDVTPPIGFSGEALSAWFKERKRWSDDPHVPK